MMNGVFDNSVQGVQGVQSPAEQPKFDFSRFYQPIRHDELLEALLEQVHEVDFMAEVNPNNTDNFKLSRKHYVVTAIEKILQLAEDNNWGLCKRAKAKFVYLYNGEYWAVVEEDQLTQFLGNAAEKMGVPHIDSVYYDFKKCLVEQFYSSAVFPVPETDPKKVLINLQNGTFEITTTGTKKRDFDPLDFMTYQLPFEYDPQATAPLFEAYLNRVLPDTQCQDVLSEYIGSLFVRHGSGLKLEKALILYGKGANGKSVFFEIVNALLGRENVCNYALQSLCDESGYYRAKLVNKLVNYASEISSRLVNSAYFKDLASGENVEARLPYGEPFTMFNYAKLIFNCNELPKDIEHTDAYFRRLLIIPFDVTIPPEERDPDLHTKIIENELSGVFNWVLRGLDRLLRQRGFSKCDAAKRAVEKYREESDSVRAFLKDCGYSVSTTKEMTLSSMFASYKTYCSDSILRPCSQKTFSERLETCGYEKHRKTIGVVVYAEKRDDVPF